MTPEQPVRLAARGSALARAQAATVAGPLASRLGRAVELVTVTTFGDTSPAPLDRIGGEGVFVAAVRDAVCSGGCDLAVHSLKDLPVAAQPGLWLAAVPPREDPRDALCARDGLTLHELPAGARVGTGSPRRVAALRAARPDLDVVAIRGNVDTRLARVADGDLDAVVLAAAGLARLSLLDRATELLDPIDVLPAPGQGALAVELRDDAAADLVAAVASLDDAATRAAVTAERALLAALEAGCSSPVGALADVTGDDEPELYLRASVTAVDGGGSVRRSATGPASTAADLGRALAETMLADGAAELMGERVR